MRTDDCKTKIKNFFGHVKKVFHKVVSGAKAFLDEAIPEVLNFVQALKVVVDNPATDFITALIPSNIDDAIVKQLRLHLGTVIDVLKLELSCAPDADIETKIAAYLNYLRNCSPAMRDAIYHKTAALLTKLHAGDSGKQFTNAEIDALVQLAYTKLKHD